MSNPLVCRLALNPLSHTNQGNRLMFYAYLHVGSENPPREAAVQPTVFVPISFLLGVRVLSFDSAAPRKQGLHFSTSPYARWDSHK